MAGNLSQGVSLYEKGRYIDSLSFFLSLSKNGLDTTNTDIVYYLGLCYTKLSYYEDALLYLEQVVTGDKDKNRVLQCRYILALLYINSGRKSLALFELNKLLDEDYKVPQVYSTLAHLSYLDNDTDAALTYYEKALVLDENNVCALNGEGYVLASCDKDLARALSCCKKAASLSPSAAVYDSLGFIYYKLGLWEDSKRYLTKAFNLNTQAKEIKEHIALLNDSIKIKTR